MSDYLIWNKITNTDFDPDFIASQYDRGFIFTREHRGAMYQSRSLRINLADFSLNSENRRVLNKVTGLNLDISTLPLADYHWQIHKLGKEYYEKKFGPNIFSANKIKEILTAPESLNFNSLLTYKIQQQSEAVVGYAIAYLGGSIMHYAYPFYDLEHFANNFGMGMMLTAILYAQKHGLKYIYLGSASRPADIYKLQFSGLEWFDHQSWQKDLEPLKKLLASA